MRKMLPIISIMLLPTVAFAFEFSDLLNPSGPIAMLALLAIEFVIGKTDWVKAGSLVELVLNMLLKLFKKDSAL